MHVQQVVGLAFDGRYFAVNTMEEIAALLLSVDSRSDHAAIECIMEWVMSIWDDAHRVELNIGDDRKDKEGVGVQLDGVS